MQDHYNLLAREEERKMIPLCLDGGVGTIIWSPLARGRLARPFEQAKNSIRSETDGEYADRLYSPAEEESNHAIIDAVGKIALAWFRSKQVVTAPLVGADSIEQINDAIASLGVALTEEEIRTLEATYMPRYDLQGISDEAELDAIRKRVPGMELK